MSWFNSGSGVPPTAFDSSTTEDHEKQVRGGFWPKLRKLSGHLPFMRQLLAAWYCTFDRATPLRVKAILLAAIAYFVMPIDAIPDILVGIGFTDDIAVLGAAFAAISSHITQRHRDQAEIALNHLRQSETPSGRGDPGARRSDKAQSQK